MFCFRIRLTVSDTARLHIAESEFALCESPSVVLRPVGSSQSIKDAKKLVILGNGYDSFATASDEGAHWFDTVRVVLARLRIGADFGERSPRGHVSAELAQRLQDDNGISVMNDDPGVIVFECEREPTFFSATAAGVRMPNSDETSEVLRSAAILRPRYSDSERLAFDLFSASFFQPAADARFMMLMMALEVLIEPAPRSDDVLVHVDALVKSTHDSNMAPSEKQSILGSLRWLRTESIGQAGRRTVAARLEPRKYMGLAPGRFFTRCYDVRSNLVHGLAPRVGFSEVGVLSANLEVFVSHLLSGPLLDHYSA